MSYPLLLTPGPLTTSSRVKQAAMVDYNPRDKCFLSKIHNLRKKILEIGKIDPKIYDVIFMQGSGTFGVESVLISRFSPNYDHLLVLSNGAYGERISTILERASIPHDKIKYPWNRAINGEDLEKYLELNDEITGIVMVHSETTSGVLNPLSSVAKISQKYGKTLVVDAMSSFGGIPIDFDGKEIDYLITSANKCLEGIPGFSIIIAKIDDLIEYSTHSPSHCLNLRDQYLAMEKNGQFRFTPPVQSILGLEEALKELEEEGGIEKRYRRYSENQYLVKMGMKAIGFVPYLEEKIQGPIITTFYYPWNNFDFEEFREILYQNGFSIYSGKIEKEKSFRVGNIGQIFSEDLERFIRIVSETIQKMMLKESKIEF